MNKRDETIYKHLMEQYKFHWDKNQYYRTEHDTCMEYYRGYRNAGDYPLIYNTSFNRILPIIHTLLSRFMDQLYQGNNIVSVKPRKRKDVDRAKSAEGILNFQLDSLNEIDAQGGSYLTMFKWFFNALTFGKGIIKAYWRKEERIGPKRMTLPKPEFDRFGNFQGYGIVDHITTEMQTVYDGPYVEVLHNKLFLPHPEYRDIQQMPQVFIVYRRSIDEVKRMADKGIYKNINELGITGSGGVSTQSMDSREAFIKSLEIYSSGIYFETFTLGFSSFNSSIFSPFLLLSSSSNIFIYNSIPTESMYPDCSLPRTSPAPLIDKSRIAILKPLPSSVKFLIT